MSKGGFWSAIAMQFRHIRKCLNIVVRISSRNSFNMGLIRCVCRWKSDKCQCQRFHSLRLLGMMAISRNFVFSGITTSRCLPQIANLNANVSFLFKFSIYFLGCFTRDGNHFSDLWPDTVARLPLSTLSDAAHLQVNFRIKLLAKVTPVGAPHLSI